MAAFIFLLLLLAAVVAALMLFLSFRKDVRGSNRRVPPAAERALAPSQDVLSKPQLILTVFDRASLFARTDPHRHLVSLLSVPSGVRVRPPSRATVGAVLATAGAAGLVRLARSALGLQVTHVALLRPSDIAPLVDAIGGVRIRDASSAGGFARPGAALVLDGAGAERYVNVAGPFGSVIRRERERAVLEAIITRLSSVASPLNLRHLARTFSATVATDLSLGELSGLALVRLRSKFSIQCALPERAQLGQPASRRVLRQFVGAQPTPRSQARIFPSNGCRISPLAAHAPGAVIFVGEQALALLPFVPQIAAGVIALDLILLLALAGAPQALIGAVRNGLGTARQRRRLAGIRDAEPAAAAISEPLDAALGQRIGRYTAADPELRASPLPAEAALVTPEIDTALQRLPNDVCAPSDAGAAREEEPAQAEASGGTELSDTVEPGPARRRQRASEMRRGLQKLAVAARRLRDLLGHPDAAVLFGGTAVAIVLGYLLSQL